MKSLWLSMIFLSNTTQKTQLTLLVVVMVVGKVMVVVMVVGKVFKVIIRMPDILDEDGHDQNEWQWTADLIVNIIQS